MHDINQSRFKEDYPIIVKYELVRKEEITKDDRLQNLQ